MCQKLSGVAFIKLIHVPANEITRNYRMELPLKLHSGLIGVTTRHIRYVSLKLDYLMWFLGNSMILQLITIHVLYRLAFQRVIFYGLFSELSFVNYVNYSIRNDEIKL